MAFTHRIVWMSDLHQTVSGRVEGVDARARLAAAVDQINRLHGDADLCIVSGELTDNGTAEEYAALAQGLAPLTLPVLPMIGNHDRRAALMAAFPVPAQALEGYYQYRHDLPGGVTILAMDTHLPGSDAGALDAARLAWLDRQLADTADRRVLVFAHHTPGPLGLGLQDDLALQDAGPFLARLAAAPQVMHLCLGHVHRPVSGVLAGVPFTAIRAVAHQTRHPFAPWDWADFTAPRERPQYAVILIGTDRVVIQPLDIEDAP